MKIVWVVIVLHQLLCGSNQAYIGVGPYAHETEEGCHESAEKTKAQMMEKGYFVSVKCERIPIDY